MKLATSRLSPQGQISVPVEVRTRLGLAPGSTIEWDLEGEVIQVRRVGRFSSEDIHQAVFAGRKVPRRSVEEMDEAIASHLKQKHARR